MKEISHIERRTPVISQEAPFSMDVVGQQWGMITEAVRREIVVNPQIRQTLLGFTTKPVSETLPDEFIKSISASDPRIARLSARYEKTLGACLALPPVPEEQITPDVSHAPSLQVPETTMEMFSSIYGKNDAMYEERLHFYIQSGTFLSGITSEERQLIARRYVYARDIKLLALGAEIIEQGAKIPPGPAGEVKLPSGISMKIDSSQDKTRTDLLSPHLWEKRKQLKDRVYEIHVNGKKYLLKEKKT